MKASNDNTIGGGPAANDNSPHVETVPDLDDLEFDRAMSGYNSMMNAIERGMIGRWFGMPDDKAPPRYFYTRAGIKGRPGTLEREQTLRAFGWRPAPAGTRYGGFLTDGENGSYWYARADVYHRMKEVQAQARDERYRRSIRGALKAPAKEFYSGEDGERLAKHGVEIGVADANVGAASFDEVMEAERAARARAARAKSRG